MTKLTKWPTLASALSNCWLWGNDDVYMIGKGNGADTTVRLMNTDSGNITFEGKLSDLGKTPKMVIYNLGEAGYLRIWARNHLPKDAWKLLI